MTNSSYNITKLKINYLDKDASEKLGCFLAKYLNKNTIIVCIGTDKCIGDSIGPLVGNFLSKENFPLPVIGTLDHPVHAVNLDETLEYIYNEYPKHFIIAVDACISHDDSIGDIRIKTGPVHPGKGVGKKLPTIGDISIIASVDTIDSSSMFSMRNIRLSLIMKLSEIIKNAFIYGASLKD